MDRSNNIYTFIRKIYRKYNCYEINTVNHKGYSTKP